MTKTAKKPIAKKHTKRARGREIVQYWHCGDEKEDEMCRLSVGQTPRGIQVWCEDHNKNVINIDLRKTCKEQSRKKTP